MINLAIIIALFIISMGWVFFGFLFKKYPPCEISFCGLTIWRKKWQKENS